MKHLLECHAASPYVAACDRVLCFSVRKALQSRFRTQLILHYIDLCANREQSKKQFNNVIEAHYYVAIAELTDSLSKARSNNRGNRTFSLGGLLLNQLLDLE